MTKYILNSGGVRNNPEGGKRFFAEMFSGLGETPRMLVCYFAQPREDWEQKFAQDTADFPALFPATIRPEITMAFPATFAQQIADTDIVYIKGGDDHLIQYWLKQYDVTSIFFGKVVATNSAGSNALVSHFWTCDWRACMDGLGLLPIKFLPHYQSQYGSADSRGPIDWEKGLSELTTYGDTSLPIHALKEGEYMVIEQ